jgi:histone chaperone ASF1
LIPPHELLGVTVVLLSCSYKDREFIKIGYYCAVNYFQDEQYMAEPPPVVEWNKMYRNLLGERPKVTRYSIPWDNEEDMQVDRTGEDVEMIGDSQIGSVMSVDMQGASYMSMG